MELIKRVDDTAAPVRLQVQVNHGSSNVAMPQQFFNGMQVGARVEQVSGKGMAESLPRE